MALVSGKDSHAGKLDPPPINWKGGCIEPIAQVILLEAMNFAIGSVQSRLNTIGKIYPEVEGSGEAMLDMIMAIRDAIDGVPNCKGSTTMKATVETSLEAPNNEIQTSWKMQPAAPFREPPAKKPETVKAKPEPKAPQTETVTLGAGIEKRVPVGAMAVAMKKARKPKEA